MRYMITTLIQVLAKIDDHIFKEGLLFMFKKEINIFLLVIMAVLISCKKEVETTVVSKNLPIELDNSTVVHVIEGGCGENGISFPSENIGYVYSCGDIYKTEDAGMTWSHIFQFEHSVRSMNFLNDNQGVVVMGYYYSEYLWNGQNIREYLYKVKITQDGGFSWKTIYNTDSERILVAYWVDDQTIIMNKTGGFYQSIDRGESWNLVHRSVPQHIAGNFNFDFVNSTTGYFYSTNDLFQTEDKGASWKVISSVSNYNPYGQEVDFFSKSHGIRKEFSGIFFTADGAKTWSPSNIDSSGIIEYNEDTYIPPYELSHPYLVNKDVSYFVGNEGIFKSSDGGLNIKRIYHSKEIDGKIYIVRKFSMFDEFNGVALADIYEIPYPSHSYSPGDYAILRTTTGWQ